MHRFGGKRMETEIIDNSYRRNIQKKDQRAKKNGRQPFDFAQGPKPDPAKPDLIP
ncbi:MAG: hypothetical protein ACYC9O_17420 [Candidatus Latescibacterota bacterium]